MEEVGEAEELEKYGNRTPKSLELFEKALAVLPEGIGGSAAPYRPYPFFVAKAKGSKVWDVDDNQYIDFGMCWGTLLVGHAHPKIVEGLREQIEEGTMYGHPHESVEALASELKRRFPIESVRFVNSGTEATMAAVRLARAYTGKEKIVKIEGAYHGWSSELHISKKPPLHKTGPHRRPSGVPAGRGIPSGTLRDTLISPFNDAETTSEILDEHLGEVAGVIVEPVMMNSGVIPPKHGYLRELRNLTEEHNALLIFDEVKTGVRIAPGGACEQYKVEPDVVCLAKAIGGGLPLGAFGASYDAMNLIETQEVPIYGTFSANPLSIRAGLIALTEILTNDAYRGMKRLGQTLFNSCRDIVRDEGLKVQVQGIGPVGCILFTDDEVKNYRDFCRVDQRKWYSYWISMLNRGVIPMPHGHDEQWLISAQHTKEDIESHLQAFKEVASNL